MTQTLEFEKLVELHYQALYRFAFSLTRNEAEAFDLTQHCFYILVKKGSQLRAPEKARSWLFTTLHREHLARRRRFARFPETELEAAGSELPPAPPPLHATDAPALFAALSKVDSNFQAAVSLFYLEDYSYAEIAEVLEIPLGTVKSRISRGIAQLQELLIERRPL